MSDKRIKTYQIEQYFMKSQPFIRYQLIFETYLKRNWLYHSNIKECFHITDILRISCYFFFQSKYCYLFIFFRTIMSETLVKEKQAKSVIANTPSDSSSVKRTRLQLKTFLVTITEYHGPLFILFKHFDFSWRWKSGIQWVNPIVKQLLNRF